MIRGQDNQYDEPNKYRYPPLVRDSLDIADIAGPQSKVHMQTRAERNSMDVADINGKPPLYQSFKGDSNRATNNAGSMIINGNLSMQRRTTQGYDMAAGSKLRNSDRVSDVFSTSSSFGGDGYLKKFDNRSLITDDIQGAKPRRYGGIAINMAAGVRTGSPLRKNDSSVFSHLTNEDGMRKQDAVTVEIYKPRIVKNDLASSHNKMPVDSNQYYMNGGYNGTLNNEGGDSLQRDAGENAYYQQDENDKLKAEDINRQYEEYMAYQRRKAEQEQINLALASQYLNQPSGYTKNLGQNNIINHDIIDVKSKSNLQSNGNQIFNSNNGGAQSNSNRRAVQEQKFEQNFQKPMADRHQLEQSNSEFYKNYTSMKPAGGQILITNNIKRIDLNQGKERLFGQYEDAGQEMSSSQFQSGKRIINSNANGGIARTYENVIGDYYGNSQKGKSQASQFQQSLFGGQDPSSYQQQQFAPSQYGVEGGLQQYEQMGNQQYNY